MHVQDAFEDLLIEYHVDLTFHGHHHSYQRTCPAHRNKCVGYGEDGVPLAPIHMVIGNAGAGLTINVHPEQPEVRRPRILPSVRPPFASHRQTQHNPTRTLPPATAPPRPCTEKVQLGNGRLHVVPALGSSGAVTCRQGRPQYAARHAVLCVRRAVGMRRSARRLARHPGRPR